MENSAEKKPKLEAFKTIRKNFFMAGISPKLATQSYPLNGKIVMTFLLLGLAFTFICVFIFNYAETFSEYTQSTYFATAVFLYIFALSVVILKVEKLFKLIDCCDDVLNMSECVMF